MNMNEVIDQFIAAMTDPEREMGLYDVACLFGAEYLSSGIDRAAYRLEDYVIKINCGWTGKDTQTRMEQVNYIRMTMEGHAKAGWAVPMMRFTEGQDGKMVAICQYIAGGTLLDNGNYLRLDGDGNPWGAYDVHGGNIIEVGGIRYLIDLGFAHGYMECILDGHEPTGETSCEMGCSY